LIGKNYRWKSRPAMKKKRFTNVDGSTDTKEWGRKERGEECLRAPGLHNSFASAFTGK